MKKLLVYIFLVVVLLSALVSLYLWKRIPPAPEIHLKKVHFAELHGWEKSDLSQSLQAFRLSCKAFLKQNPEKSVGSKFLQLKAKEWQPICHAAFEVDEQSPKKIKAFFEAWFTPAAFHTDRPIDGLFTGYYMPLLKGNLTKTEEFNVPIYGVPDDLITVNLEKFDPQLKHHRKLVGRVKNQQLIPYFTREEIINGAIQKHAPVIAWINNRVDRQFLEIEGSGVIELPDGSQIVVSYAAENGRPYTSIAGILIKKNVLTKHNASMQGIRNYFKNHPSEINDVLNQNQSFVFFEKLKRVVALGSQGVALTPGYSLAVDRQWIPMGVPIWLETTRPDKEAKKQSMQRLMIAQDTGGAIKGPVRGDVYWGTGDEAVFIAGHMKNKGTYWLLLPKPIIEKLESTAETNK